MKGIIIAVLVILVGVFAWMYLSPMASTKSTTPTKTTTTSGTGSSKTTTSGQTIEIKDFAYAPKTLTVKAGSKVTVTNSDLMGHSVTADDGSFDTGVLSQNESGSFTAPTTPGTYAFHCTPHPSIQGTLVVE